MADDEQDDAAHLLEIWERALEREKDKKRQHDEGQPASGKPDGRDWGHTEMERVAASPRAPRYAPGDSPRERRTSVQYGSVAMYRTESNDGFIKKVMQVNESSPGPVGTRSTRRNSYSIGYGNSPRNSPVIPALNDIPNNLGKPVESVQTAALIPGGGRVASFASGTSGAASPLEQKGRGLSGGLNTSGEVVHSPPDGHQFIPLSSMIRGSSTPNAGAAAAAAVGAPAGEAATIGGKIKKLITRTISRRQLMSKPQNGDAVSVKSSGTVGDKHGPGSLHGDLDIDEGEELEVKTGGTHGYTGDSDRSSNQSQGMGFNFTGDVQSAPVIPGSKSTRKGQAKAGSSHLRTLITLSPFVPRLLIEEIILDEPKYQAFDEGGVRELVTASKALKPSMKEFQGAVMIADVKGFTQLTEILSKKGTAGVELLTNCMNNYFTRVINMILAFDGDVVKFAGDSMIVVFSPTPTERDEDADQGIHAATLRCAQCAHVLASRLGHMRMKMNGQVEPINIQATSDTVEPEDSTRAKFGSGPIAGMAPLSPDPRSLLAVQHAAQQVAAMRMSTGTGSDSTGSGIKSVGNSGRGSPVSTEMGGLLHNLPSEMPYIPVPGDNQMAGASGAGYGADGSSHGTLTAPGTPAGGVSAGLSKSMKKGSWISSMMKKPGKKLVLETASSSSSIASNPMSVTAAASTTMGGAPAALAGALRGKKTDAANSPARSVQNDSNLWADGGGMVRREMSLASKLNIPPPVRVLAPSTSRASLQIVPGDYPVPAVQQTQASFTDASDPVNRMMAPLAAGMRRGPTESWASKFQHLSSGVTGAAPEATFSIERSHTSLGNVRPLLPSTDSVGPSEAELETGPKSRAQNTNSDEFKPTPSAPSRSRLGGMKTAKSLRRKQASDGLGGGYRRSVSQTSSLAGADSVEAPEGSKEHGSIPALPVGAPVEWSEDSYAVDALAATGSSFVNTAAAGSKRQVGRMRAEPVAQIDGYMAPGTPGSQPLGEGHESDRLGALHQLLESFTSPGLRVNSSPQQLPSGRWSITPHEDSWISAGSATTVPCPSRVGSCMFGLKSGWLPRGSRLVLDSNASFACRALGLQETYSGPVAEGVFKVATEGDSRAGLGSHIDPGSQSELLRTPDGKHGLMGKMMHWLGGSTIKRGTLQSGHMDFRGDERDEESGQDDSSPVAAFGYQNPRLATPGTGYTKTRDPVMEEVQNSEFSLKIMISAGTVSVFQVGGLIDEVTDPTMPEVPHWEFFIGDTPLAPLRDQNNRRRCIAQLALIEDQAEAGKVVCSREVMDLLQDDWDIDVLVDDVGMMRSTKQTYLIPARQHQPIFRGQKDAAPTRQPSGKLSMQPALDTMSQEVAAPMIEEDAPDAQSAQHELSSLSDDHQKRLAGVLRMHVLGSVRSRIEAGHLDFVNEIRPLTCLFLGFPSLLNERHDATHDEQVSCVQYSMQQVQHVMRKWDGSLLQFRCDEKGYLGICAFGLPGHTHEDNPSRGILAALELQRRIKEKSHNVCIGVTTGDLLCTCVGARKIRSEYTVFGDAINLSARLMVKCKNGMAEILCDEPTYLHAKFKASFEELQPLPVKGKKLPVHVFSVTPFNKETAAAAATVDPANAMSEAHGGQRTAGGAPERPLVGRDTETSFILNRAANMIAGMATGGAIVIEGNTGMGKTKLLSEVRRSLERIHLDTAASGTPVFHLFFGVADIANKNTKLHPWRRTFQELFATDRDRSAVPQPQEGEQGAADAAAASNGPVTALGNRLAQHIPSYNTEWSKHLADLLELPLAMIPKGAHAASDDFVTPAAAGGAQAQQAAVPEQAGDNQPGVPSSRAQQSNGGNNTSADGVLRAIVGGRALTSLTGNTSMRNSRPATTATNHTPSSGSTAAAASQSGGQNLLDVLPEGTQTSISGASNQDRSTFDKDKQQLASAGNRTGSVILGTVGPAPAPNSISARRSPSHTPLAGSAFTGMGAAPPTIPTNANAMTNANTHAGAVPAPLKKNSLNFLVHVIREYTALYGPMIIMLENLHEFDTWSWQLLVKVAEVLSPAVLILATTRPNEMSPNTTPGQSHGKLALYQKVAMMYRHLLKLPTTSKVHLQPFTFLQTKALMQVVADNHYPDQYVLAVMEKTGGMPLYIEKVTEFLCQKPWLADQGGEFTANVNKMIRNLNFQQVIIERMDRLKPGIHLSLKVASVMGQWVDLDILHKFYPITKSKDELRGHLMELERGNFLKPTDTEGVWEFNMVERDIVYEVIPHYQRRRLHAKLAQELERSLEEQHVATLTTIAYHWNQACMGHEVTEVECALKAIEYWQRAAEAGYSGSSLMEALRLYQKAAQIAELLADSMGDSFQAHASRRGSPDSSEGGSSETGKRPKNKADQEREDNDDANASFTAVGAAFRGQLNWSLISRITRAQWEKSMASCCLGIVMQHRLEFNNQMEFWDSEDYFTLLTEHAIRGLMLLGAPHPQDVLLQDHKRTGLARFLCCFNAEPEEPLGWREGVVLQDQEVTEIRDILLVLIIAAEHYSLQQDGDEYTRLLTFCKRVCIFFKNCSDSGLDPFTDIQVACTNRIKNFKARKGSVAVADFDLGGGEGELLDDGDDGSFNDGMGPLGGLDPHGLSSVLSHKTGSSWPRNFN